MRNGFLVDAARIRFTKHAIEKFEILKHYGLIIEERQVVETVLRPERGSMREVVSFSRLFL